MTPTFLVRTRTGRYLHAAWLPMGGVRILDDDLVINPSLLCRRVPGWHSFWLADGPPGHLGDGRPRLCPTCAQRLRQLADRDDVVPTVAVAI